MIGPDGRVAMRRDPSVRAKPAAGDRAPAFVLKDRHGRYASSREMLSRGPLVVSFFRGTWCPYCVEELSGIAAAYDAIRATGANVVALTPQSAESLGADSAKRRFPFPILIDPDAQVAESFGLAFTPRRRSQGRVREHVVDRPGTHQRRRHVARTDSGPIRRRVRRHRRRRSRFTRLSHAAERGRDGCRSRATTRVRAVIVRHAPAAPAKPSIA